VWLRINSKELAWPTTANWSGPRENTSWAIREAALNDVAIALLALGVLVLAVAAYAISKDESAVNLRRD
jgi:hypothetical protein